MLLLNNYEVSVNDIAREIRSHGAVVDNSEATVDLVSFVFPDNADETSLFLSIDWRKRQLDLCLIDSAFDNPVYPSISYDKTELDLLIAFVLYLLDEKAA